MFIFERQTERESEREKGRKREGDTKSEGAPGSALSAQSPTWGLNPQIVRS